MTSSARPLRSRIRLVLSLALVLLAVWAGSDLAYVSIGAETDHAAPADVILVLGCNPYAPEGGPSVCMRARAGHAADLYSRGLAPHVIASGGPTTGGPPEASVIESVLQQDGVPSYAIVIEDRSFDTIQNIINSQAIMREHGWRTAVLVTEPFHIKRAALIAQDVGMTVYPSPATDSINWSDPLLRAFNLSRDTLSLMLYQVKHATGMRD
jgi:uncharacterized SAM-binding protein YcdF (DUF218 family)